MGWVGIPTDALLSDVAPKVLAGLKRHGNESIGELAVTVRESGRGAVFTTAKDLTAPEASIQAGPLLPLWTLSGRHQGTTSKASLKNSSAAAWHFPRWSFVVWCWRLAFPCERWRVRRNWSN